MQGNATLPGTSSPSLSSFSSRAHPLTLPSISSSGTPLEDEGDEDSGLRIRRVLESNRSPLTEGGGDGGLAVHLLVLVCGWEGRLGFFS